MEQKEEIYLLYLKDSINKEFSKDCRTW